MAEVKLICGRDVMGKQSYLYTNERGEQVEILVWLDQPGDEVWLYPAGVHENGRAVEPGHRCAGLLSAQLEAIEILSHD